MSIVQLSGRTPAFSLGWCPAPRPPQQPRAFGDQVGVSVRLAARNSIDEGRCTVIVASGTNRTRAFPAQARRLARRSIRPLAQRVLGEQPSPVATASSPSKPRANPRSDLRQHGLRVEPSFKLLGAGVKSITVSFEPPVQLNNEAMVMYRDLRIGRYSYFRSGRVRHVSEVGRYSSVGPGVIIGEAEHPADWLTTSPSAFDRTRWHFYPPDADCGDRLIKRTSDNVADMTLQDTTIGNDVWIGANVMIRRGVNIGDGAIVGAGSFVNRDVAPYSIIAGLPAKKVGMRFSDDVVSELLDLRWWDFDISDLAGVSFDDVESSIQQIREWEASGRIARVPLQYNSVVLTKSSYKSLHIDSANTKRATARLDRIKERRKS